jgi:hypothetical protein
MNMAFLVAQRITIVRPITPICTSAVSAEPQRMQRGKVFCSNLQIDWVMPG